MVINCHDCAHFIKDEIGDGNGIGSCKKLTEYLAKTPSPGAIFLALQQLGQPRGSTVFWGGIAGRECVKFEARKHV